MRPTEKTIQNLIQNLNDCTRPDLDQKILNDCFAELNAQPTPALVPRPNVWRLFMHSKLTKLTAAAIIIIAALIGINHFDIPIDGATVAWADVVERFHSVNYFSAVFYHRTNAQSTPEQIELWVGKGGKARIHIEGQVVFCSDGHIQKVFDMKTGTETEPKEMAKGMFDTFLRNITAFSLETVLELLGGERLVDVTAVINEDNLISSELVMFDVKHQNSPQWFRIWALRKSKLPLHLRMLDPRNGGCDDVVFDYSREPKDLFFDPVAFSEAVKTTRSPNLIPYLLWEDQTGKTMTPKKPDEVKLFDFQTKTFDGQPWSFSDHRGKTILITFWYGSARPLGKFSKAVEERFGNRDDFLMTVIVLRNPDKARDYFKNKPRWIALQDSDENIERIFGSVSEDTVFILDKYGQLRKSINAFDERFGVAAVDEALNGVVYDSNIKPELFGSTEEKVLRQYGKPDSMETKNQETIWRYRRFNNQKTEYKDISVTFNQEKIVVSIASGHGIVDPATAIVRISQAWWQKEIVEKLTPNLLSQPNAVFTVSFRQSNSCYPLCGDAYGAKPVSFKPETPYSRKMVPGKYDLEIELRETKSPYKLLWNKILIKDCELLKNQEKEIIF